MTGDQLPDDDHVAYYCSSFRIDGRGLPSARAFLPRDKEKHLSVNWLEYFSDSGSFFASLSFYTKV